MISPTFQASIAELRKFLAGKILQCNLSDIEFGSLQEIENSFWANFNIYLKTNWYTSRSPFYRTDLNQDLFNQYAGNENPKQKNVLVDNIQMAFLGSLEKSVFSSCLTPVRALGHVLARAKGQRDDNGVFKNILDRLVEYNGT